MAAHDPCTIRPSVIAGGWYPGTEPALRRALDGYFAGVDQAPVPGRLCGLIAPHAGYAYSGQTAAHAYRQLQGRSFTTVVVLAPSHRAWFDGCAVNTEDAYETPLGRVSIDREFVEALAARTRVQPMRGDAEHAIEIQLPFLQSMLGSFRLVPILVGSDDPALPQQLARALSETAGLPPWQRGIDASTGLLLVASSDMHHIESYEEVVRRDRPVVDAVAAYDLEALTPLLTDRRCSVCGRMPILAVLHACRLLGADAVRVLHYTNSGDVTGQRRAGTYTVGYMSAAVYERTPIPS
jgi:AmmeMemoRadiSam system protein B